jgi:hypothetical protein
MNVMMMMMIKVNYVISVKGEGRLHEGPEGELRYSSTLSLTLALEEGG